MNNKTIIDELYFSRGTGTLYYNLYNWKINVKLPKIGVVFF